MRVLRYLARHDDACVCAVLNHGTRIYGKTNYEDGAAVFAKGQNFVWRKGSPRAAFMVGSKTIEALWPEYIDQQHESSGNERRFYITDMGRAAIAAGSRRAKTPQAVECEASQSGGEAVSPTLTPCDPGATDER